MFCTSCGQNLPEGKAFCTNCGAPAGEAGAQTAPAGGPAPEGAYTPVQAPVPAGAPGRPKRTGLIAGVVIAALVVVAAAGVGIWLALRGDDTAGQAAAGDGAATTMVVPGVDGGTEGDGSVVTGPLDPTSAAYRTAVGNVLGELDFGHGRIPELADTINATLPDVPQPVYDDLQVMAGRLAGAVEALEAVAVPAGYEEANGYLLDAAEHMANRIQATMDGIQAAWDAGATAPSLPYFAEGREQRDAYVDAIEDFQSVIPAGFCDT